MIKQKELVAQGFEKKLEKIKKQIQLQPTSDEIMASNKLGKIAEEKAQEVEELRVELERIRTEYLECQQLVGQADRELIQAKDKYLKIHRANQRQIEQKEADYVNYLPQVKTRGAGFVLRNGAPSAPREEHKNVFDF